MRRTPAFVIPFGLLTVANVLNVISALITSKALGYGSAAGSGSSWSWALALHLIAALGIILCLLPAMNRIRPNATNPRRGILLVTSSMIGFGAAPLCAYIATSLSLIVVLLASIMLLVGGLSFVWDLWRSERGWWFAIVITLISGILHPLSWGQLPIGVAFIAVAIILIGYLALPVPESPDAKAINYGRPR